MVKFFTLNTKCPHCGVSFMDSEVQLHSGPSIKLNLETENEKGTLRLCAVYGCYDHESDIDLKEGQILKFYCPHCNQQLSSNDKCDAKDCGAPMIPLTLELGGKVFFCSRKGCSKHFVAFENLETEIMNFHNELKRKQVL